MKKKWPNWYNDNARNINQNFLKNKKSTKMLKYELAWDTALIESYENICKN